MVEGGGIKNFGTIKKLGKEIPSKWFNKQSQEHFEKKISLLKAN